MRRLAWFTSSLFAISMLAVGCGDDSPPGSMDAGDLGDGFFYFGDRPEEGCGNFTIEEPEICDDGNTEDGDGCSADCLSLERCGNGITDTAIGEICDDGNSASGDGCAADCASDETCGNNIVDLGAGEVCDDGNTADDDGCSGDCMTGPTCGDGITHPGEVCDDGNTDDGDGCSGDCQSDETCGNDVLDSGEECDDGNNDPDDGCSATCTIERCGNGIVEGTEQCDDDNAVPDDGCEDDCTFSCTMDMDCDDGLFCNGAETCDTGSNTCAAGMAPADGTDCMGGMVCRGGACVMPVCGNGILETGEDCDDMNSIADDGCENDCSFSCTMNADCDDSEVCNGTETCNTTTNVCNDPADLSDGTSCGAMMECRGGVCTTTMCGNGIVEGGEDCDDMNTTGGDGCENDCSWSCTAAADCDDGDVCNGMETCTIASHTCSAGSAAADGVACDRDMDPGTRDICQGGGCAASICGDMFVDPGATPPEDCDDGNATAGDGCENDCSFTCTVAADCDDGDVCNGAETCNTSNNTCGAGSPPADGTMCDRGMGTRDICLMTTCGESVCGDNYTDMGATPAEACDDGNLVSGDGCEPDCTVSGPRPTAYRITSMDLMDPHIYADVPIPSFLGGGCRDITDNIPLSSQNVNALLQASLDDYTLNYINVFRPIDIAAMSTPLDVVDGICAAPAMMGDPPMCMEEPTMGMVFPSNANNMSVGSTCYTADPTTLSTYGGYTAPRIIGGPCFLSDDETLTIVISGIVIPLSSANVSATYIGGLTPTSLTGVISGFLSVADAQAALLPDTLPGFLASTTLYSHLVHGGAAGSCTCSDSGSGRVNCNSRDDSDTHMGVTGFWMYLNFTADPADWSGP